MAARENTDAVTDLEARINALGEAALAWKARAERAEAKLRLIGMQRRRLVQSSRGSDQ